MLLPSRTAIIFRASRIQQQRTGLHAYVEILAQSNGAASPTLLDSTFDNLDRSEARTRLANAAYKLLKKDQSTYDPERFKADLSLFCNGLWAAFGELWLPSYVEGDALDSALTFHLTPYVLRNGGTVLFGAGGGLKSYLTMLMAVSINAGVSTLWPVIAGNVLYVNLERSASLLTRRLGRVNQALGLPRNFKLLMLNARGRSLPDVADPIRRAIARYNIDCVFLDSISRAGLGKLTEDQTANSGADLLNSLSPTWVAIAHKSKASLGPSAGSDADHAFGSIMFENASDLGVSVTTQIKENIAGAKLTVIKANDAPFLGHRETFALSFDQFGLVSCRHAEKWEFPDLALKGQRVDLLEEIKDFILDQPASPEHPAAQATATQIAKATGHHRGSIASILTSSSDFSAFRRGREVYYGLKSDRA